jgi:hypothetical protein
MKKLIGFAVITLIVAACNDGASTTGNASDPSDPVVGTWTWIRTESGESTKIPWTPTTEGYRQTYKFDSDSVYAFTRTPDTGKVSRSGQYRISQRFDAISKDSGSFVSFLPSPPTLPAIEAFTRLQFHGQDTMLLGEGATDGPVEFYVRTR